MSTLGLIFTATHTKEDFEITKERTIASLPIGGRYRLIDFALSSLVNNEIDHVGIVTKSNYQSLVDHVGSGKSWDLARKRGGLTILPPYGGKLENFGSRIEALKTIRTFIAKAPEDYVILADSYHICNLDYEPVLAYFKATGADIVCVYQCKEVSEYDYTPVKTFTLAADGRVKRLDVSNSFRGKGNVSLDIWLMRRKLLLELVDEALVNDYKSFNQDILAKKLTTLAIYAYKYPGYLRDISDLKSYFAANMALLSLDVRKELFSQPRRPIYTKVHDSAPTYYGPDSTISNVLIADGCLIDGDVEDSIIFRNVKVGKAAQIKHSIIMQGTSVAPGVSVEYVVADKNVKITRSVAGTADAPCYLRKNGEY